MIFIAVRSPSVPSTATNGSTASPTSPRRPRAEPGNLVFEWSVDAADPGRFVLLEAFASPEAGAAHVGSGHFKAAMAWMPDIVAETPDIINVEVEGRGWSPMATHGDPWRPMPEIMPRR
jgi:quinol monooxygenase YgiN